MELEKRIYKNIQILSGAKQLKALESPLLLLFADTFLSLALFWSFTLNSCEWLVLLCFLFMLFNCKDRREFNTIILDHKEILPGDIVFITSSKERITHAGLFIRWKDDDTIELINASSFHGNVCVVSWPLEDSKRNQWIVGFGRLLIANK